MTSNTSPLLYAAESWDRVYKAFEQINFVAYDYDAIKQSLLDYLKFHYAENFNDYIESSQLIAIVESFSYIAEILAYRVDISIHENLLSDATRKQSILKLAKLISYTASRNLPLRGLVKITSITVSEDVRDSQGNSLANRNVKWNDSNNSLWREQFFSVINRILVQTYGNPYKSTQIDDTVFQQYEISNLLETENERSSFKNGVIKFKLQVEGQDLAFELVPADIDADGVFERSPNPNAYFTMLYADDGYGDDSDTTGFMAYIKQGTLLKLTKVFDFALPNRAVDVDVANINDVDVWVQEVDDLGVIKTEWENVPNVSGVNLAFNNIANTKKYEIESLEDDKIKLIFGDGDFSDIPTGIFNVWVRQSNSGSITVPKSAVTNQNTTFAYTDRQGKTQSCTLTYTLSAALQNSAESEDIEHIRAAAPSVYYTQNRMVNGQDYNSFMLKDSSILRLRAVNRTFAGQPKYITWNDASGAYQNVKVFGDDARVYYGITSESEISKSSARSLIDEVIEPALSNPGIYNLVVYAFRTSATPLNLPFIRPRTRFIEDTGINLQEKTVIQGLLDRHWYGEPDGTVLLDVNLSETSGLAKTAFAIVNQDSDKKIYDPYVKMVTKDQAGVYTLVPSVGNVSGIQDAVLNQSRFGIGFNPDRAFESALRIRPYSTNPTAIPVSDLLTSANITQLTAKEEIWTIEIVDSSGAFTVYGSLSGYQPAGQIGVPYTNGILNFLIGFPPLVSNTITAGDAFIIQITKVLFVYTPSIYKKNLTGKFEIINEGTLPVDAETNEYDVSVEAKSWLMIIQRIDDESGNLAYWNITKRNFGLTVASDTTKFWYNQSATLVDSDTKKPVYDVVKILKSNLNAARTGAVGTDQVYQVVSDVRQTNGDINFNALSVTSTDATTVFYSNDGAPTNPFEFLNFISPTDFVYFTRDDATGNLTPTLRTAYLQSLTYVEGISGNYVRKRGRDGLDFMWQHFTPNDHLIDPSPSNIIDMYLLTRGYYSQLQRYLKNLSIEPKPPTSLDLRSSYRGLLESKMISDTVVLHPGKVKLLFGNKAVPELRAKFRIVRSPEAKLTGDQIRARTLGLINQYFQIESWDFGQSFYATELCAIVHKTLPTEILSIVLVPEFPSNYFGDLFYITAAPDEILVSAAELVNIDLIEGVDRLTLRQKS